MGVTVRALTRSAEAWSSAPRGVAHAPPPSPGRRGSAEAESGRETPARGTCPGPQPMELGCSFALEALKAASCPPHLHSLTPTPTHHLPPSTHPKYPPHCFYLPTIYPSTDLAICPCIYPTHQLSIHPLPCLPICPTHTSTWPPLLTYLSTLHPVIYSLTHLSTSPAHIPPSTLSIQHPPTYPSSNYPSFVHLLYSCPPIH